jgi:hypothetical protein
MTYTFDPSLSTDLALVRFHIGDTSEAGAYLQDETITALLASSGSVGGAVIASIKYIITQLSQPNFSLDWLSVDPASARAGYENLLKQKAQEFGISLSSVSAVASISLPHRADSGENEGGLYSDDAGYLGGTG